MVEDSRCVSSLSFHMLSTPIMGQEAQTKRIELPDDNPAMIKRMLQFCYGMTYSFSPGYDENPDAIYNPHCHAAMYALAEKYEIEGLKTIARINFTNGMKLGMACKAGIPSISTLVPLVYTGTPESDRTLRDELVNYSQKKWELIDVVERKAALHNPEFAFDMIDSKPVVPPPPMYERYCERCCVTSS